MISIIMPVYNVENYLEDTINSVINQTYEDFELLIIDDGSTDNTKDICIKYLADKRVKYIYKNNGGVSSARNIALNKAKGQYIVFIDGDDIVDNNYLQTLVALMEDFKVDLAICGMYLNNQNIIKSTNNSPTGKLTQIQTARGLFNRSSFRGFLPNKIFKKQIIDDNNLRLDESAHMCEDALFCTEYVKYINSAYFITDPLYTYVQRKDSATKQTFNANRFSVLSAYRKVMITASYYQDNDINSWLCINFLVHCLVLHRMLIRNSVSGFVSERNAINETIRKNKMLFFDRRLPFKHRIYMIAALLVRC